MKARSSGEEAGRSRHGAIGADAVVTNDPFEMASTRFECARKIIESATAFALLEFNSAAKILPSAAAEYLSSVKSRIA